MKDLLLVVVLPILVAIIFYRLGLQKKEPRWAIRTATLIRDYKSTLPGLDILYKGRPIETLSVSVLLFLNRGRATIDGNDLQTLDPLRIEVVREDIEILDATVLPHSRARKSADLRISNPSGGRALIQFAYLNGGWVAPFQVVHTGRDSDDLRVVGDIKGSSPPKPIQIPSSRPLFGKGKQSHIIDMMLTIIIGIPAVIMGTFILVGIGSILVSQLGHTITNLAADIFLISLSVLGVSIGLFFLGHAAHSNWNARLFEDLESLLPPDTIDLPITLWRKRRKSSRKGGKSSPIRRSGP